MARELVCTGQNVLVTRIGPAGASHLLKELPSLAALASMLMSCAAGVMVCNVDSGFGGVRGASHPPIRSAIRVRGARYDMRGAIGCQIPWFC